VHIIINALAKGDEDSSSKASAKILDREHHDGDSMSDEDSEEKNDDDEKHDEDEKVESDEESDSDDDSDNASGEESENGDEDEKVESDEESGSEKSSSDSDDEEQAEDAEQPPTALAAASNNSVAQALVTQRNSVSVATTCSYNTCLHHISLVTFLCQLIAVTACWLPVGWLLACCLLVIASSFSSTLRTISFHRISHMSSCLLDSCS
jgi:hypothetical protein